MLLTSAHTFEVPNYGRSISDQAWETVDVEHISTWKSALQAHRLTLADCAVDIHADWTPILRKHEQHYAVMKRLREGVKGEDEIRSVLQEFPKAKAKVSVAAEVIDGAGDRAEGAHINVARSAIESHLHDSFLILNLSAPSCCDFYRAALLGGHSTTDISLSNVHFEIALLGSFKKEWPTIKTLPLSEVVMWFYSVRIGAAQIPQNPMDKVLFALLHISKLDMTPMIVIWLFYAFESLLQTKVGENYSTMIARIVALLELNENQSKILKHKFRALYNIRSAIVHGGFEVSHPMHNEILDKRVDENYERLSNATEYGLTTLVAAIQNIVVRGWRYPTFEEKMHGVPVS